jgi:hypothetical protein
MSAFSRLTAGDANVVLIDEIRMNPNQNCKKFIKKNHGIRCKRFETLHSL